MNRSLKICKTPISKFPSSESGLVFGSFSFPKRLTFEYRRGGRGGASSEWLSIDKVSIGGNIPESRDCPEMK